MDSRNRGGQPRILVSWIVMGLLFGRGVLGAEPGVEVKVGSGPADGLGSRVVGEASGGVVSRDGTVVGFTSGRGHFGEVGGHRRFQQVWVSESRLGDLERISERRGGGGGGLGDSWGPTMSTDGQVVAFQSRAEDLVEGDENQEVDVFVRHRATGTTTLVSVTPGGRSGARPSYDPVLSGDGRRVVFWSHADDLVAADPNLRQADVFLRDLEAGTTRVLSVAGMRVNRSTPLISMDGARIGFVAVQGSHTDLWVTDGVGAAWRATERVNQAVGATLSATRTVRQAVLSSDGRRAVCVLSVGGVLGERIVGVDLETKEVVVIASPPVTSGLLVTGESEPSLSADGVRVAYLLQETAHAPKQLWLWDQSTQTQRRITTRWGTDQASDRGAVLPILDHSGRWLVFTSRSTDLLETAVEGMGAQVYRWDAEAGNLEWVSRPRVAGGVPGHSSSVALSGDGKVLAWSSAASDQVEGDWNHAQDVFVLRSEDGVVTSPTLPGKEPQGPRAVLPGRSEISDQPMDRSGRWLVFSSTGGEGVGGDVNSTWDVYLRDLVSGEVRLVSRTVDGRSGNGPSRNAFLRSDGNSVAFESHATDLVSGEGKAGMGVYLYAVETGMVQRLGPPAELGETWPWLMLEPRWRGDGSELIFQGLVRGTVVVDSGGWELYRYAVADGRTTWVTERGEFAQGPVSIRGAATWAGGSGSLGFVAVQGRQFWMQDTAGEALRLAWETTGVMVGAPVMAEDGSRWAYVETGRVEGPSVLQWRRAGSDSPSILAVNARRPRWGGNSAWLAYDAVEEGTGAWRQVFLAEVGTGTRLTLSVTKEGVPGAGGESWDPQVGPGGDWVVFRTRATNLVDLAGNATTELMLWDREGGTRRLLPSGLGRGVSGRMVGLPDGSGLVLESHASDLVAGDDNDEKDVFLVRWLGMETLFRARMVVQVGTGRTWVEWDATAGSVYRVEYRNSWGQDGWVPLVAEHTVEGTVGSVEDMTTAGVTTRFYRVVRLR